jgi:Ca-activated chloride channel family protein
MTFEWPYLLYGLALIPILALLYGLVQRRRRAYTVRFTNLALLREVVGRGPGIRRHVPPLLFLLGVAALLVSLARPSAVIAVPREEAPVVLVVDVSGSMEATDMRPNRMDAAKQAARTFVEALPDQAQVGLVSFNSEASVNAPLTRDRQTVLRAIDRLRANGGTAIGDGLSLGLDQLERQPPDSSDSSDQRTPGTIVLLSDGQSQTGRRPSEVSARAQQEGVKVHTVGIGQRGTTTLLNRRVPVGLDEATLRSIAETTGGRYFYAAESAQLEQIYADLSSQVSWIEERTEVTALVSALGTLFVTFAGLLSLRWFQQLP